MPCWPDLWSRASGSALPRLVLVVIVLLLWAPAVGWRWLRIVLRMVGGAAAILVLVLVSIGWLRSGKPKYRTLDSPNGLNRATLEYESGFLGRDFSSVELTKNGFCKRFTAYEYDGPSDLTSTTLLWLDDSHLQIQYRADPNRYQHCETRVADIIIACTPLKAKN
jgi:hypothetical protein